MNSFLAVFGLLLLVALSSAQYPPTPYALTSFWAASPTCQGAATGTAFILPNVCIFGIMETCGASGNQNLSTWSNFNCSGAPVGVLPFPNMCVSGVTANCGPIPTPANSIHQVLYGANGCMGPPLTGQIAPGSTCVPDPTLGNSVWASYNGTSHMVTVVTFTQRMNCTGPSSTEVVPIGCTMSSAVWVYDANGHLVGGSTTGTPPATTGTPPATTGMPPATTGMPPATTGMPATTGKPPPPVGAGSVLSVGFGLVVLLGLAFL